MEPRADSLFAVLAEVYQGTRARGPLGWQVCCLLAFS
jgi:hypothetical protein